MKPSIESVIRDLGTLTLSELRIRYETLYQEPCYSKHKPYIIKRLIWKMQSQTENRTLPPELLQRAELLASGAEARLTGSDRHITGTACSRTSPIACAPPALEEGNIIRRKYKGRNISVQITETGFTYNGKPYRSLSAVAKEITGSHINGKAFFKVTI